MKDHAEQSKSRHNDKQREPQSTESKEAYGDNGEIS